MSDLHTGRHWIAAALALGLALFWQLLAVGITDIATLQPASVEPAVVWSHWQAYSMANQQFALAQTLTGFACVIVLVYTLFAIYRPNRDLHGNAHFASAREIEGAGLKAKKGILLARHKGSYLVFDGQEFVMLAAPTRTGKGVSVVIPNLLNWQASVVVLDVKLENWRMTSGWRQKVLKQAVYLFNPFEPSGQTHRWNPLDFVSRDPVQTAADVLQIATVLYPSNAGDRNRFFQDTAQSLFMGLAMFLIETKHPRTTIGEVFRQGSGYGKPLTEHVTAIMAEHKDVLSNACRDCLQRVLTAPGETFGNIKATFDAALLIFSIPTVDWATSASDFRLEDIRRTKQSIYFGLQIDRLEFSGRLINLFFTQVINLNTRVLPEDDKSLKHQALLILDEFPAFGKLPVVQRGVAFIAGYNLRLLTIVQAPSQLAHPDLYGREGAQTLLANHAVRLMFPPTTQQEAKEYSEMLGTYTYAATSTSQSSNGGAVFSLDSRNSSGKNTSDQKRALLLPQELKALPRTAAIVDKQGMSPAMCQKVFYYQDPIFLGRLSQVSQSLAALKRLPTEDEMRAFRVAGEFVATITTAVFKPFLRGTAQEHFAEVSAQQAVQYALNAQARAPKTRAAVIEQMARDIAPKLPRYQPGMDFRLWQQAVRDAYFPEYFAREEELNRELEEAI